MLYTDEENKYVDSGTDKCADQGFGGINYMARVHYLSE